MNQTVTVDYRTADGGAVAGTDYVAQNGTLTFAPNQVRKDINVEILEDGVSDHGEKFRVWLENPTGPAVLTQFYWALGTIYDDKPFLTADDATGTEGTDATIDFPVRLSKAAQRNVTVAYATSNGSATAGQRQDYTATSGTLTFESGETEKTISVPLLDDARAESSEQLNLTLQSPQRANFASPNQNGQIEAIGTILNAEPLAASIADASGTEGVDATIDFVVSLNRPTVRRVTINVLFSSGSADFSDVNPPEPNSVTFEPGETQKTFAVGIVDDSVNEPQETFSMVLQTTLTPDLITLADSTGAGIIYNSESLTARFKNLPTEHDGATAFTVDVFFSNEISATAATLRDHAFTVTGAEVTDAEQIHNRTDRWRITLQPAGEGAVTITLLDERDCAEAGAICTDEENPVMLSNSPAATIAGPEAGDNTVSSTEPAASVTGGTSTEGTATSVTFTVTLDEAPTQTVTIDYATTDGTATAGSDYTSTSGTLTFADGATSQTITVPIADDTENENDETFTVTLSNPAGATLKSSSATGTIANRTVTPSASIAGGSATEGTDSAISFTVTLDNAADRDRHDRLRDRGRHGERGQRLHIERRDADLRRRHDEADDHGAGRRRHREREQRDIHRDALEPGRRNPRNEQRDGHHREPLCATAAHGELRQHADRAWRRGTSEPIQVRPLVQREREHGLEEAALPRLRAERRPYREGAPKGPGRRHEEPALDHLDRARRLGDVTITLPGGRTCGAANAICTSDNRTISNSPTATVRGPAALSVADASANENTDTGLEFPVTLGRASTLTVTVAYATSNGTATAGQDYTATSGTLTFNPGDTAKTVTVPILNDAIDDGGETVTLTLSNPTNARITDGTATGTIENSDPLQRDWIARFGRTVASDVVDGITDRLASRGGGSEAARRRRDTPEQRRHLDRSAGRGHRTR